MRLLVKTESEILLFLFILDKKKFYQEQGYLA